MTSGMLFCDDHDDEDPEVFFGAKTAKEERKASKYHRQTAVFIPGFRRNAGLMRYTISPCGLRDIKEETTEMLDGQC